ncbi:unnamed protein product [Boreogadus saida]
MDHMDTDELLIGKLKSLAGDTETKTLFDAYQHDKPFQRNVDLLGQALVDFSIKVCQAKESGEFRPANTIIDHEQNVNMT